jgi:hypothetical protein|nr:MAG TPA: hypothetical protein [Caudoviricetes sp.]
MPHEPKKKTDINEELNSLSKSCLLLLHYQEEVIFSMFGILDTIRNELNQINRKEEQKL